MVTVSAQPASPAGTPEAITTVATGFMAAKHLFTASALGLFAQLRREVFRQRQRRDNARLEGIAAFLPDQAVRILAVGQEQET